LEQSRYVLLIAVGALLLASITLLVWGAYQTLNTVWGVINGTGTPGVTIAFIELIDTLLVATVLYVFAVAIYELFVGDLKLPDWLVVHNLDELKAKLIGVIVLVIAVAFAEHFIAWTDSQKLWQNGISAAVVIGALALFNRFGANHN
jgi:uncharacterized membrane protein YqhA